MSVRLSERCLSDGQSDITRAIKESSIVMILSDAVLLITAELPTKNRAGGLLRICSVPHLQNLQRLSGGPARLR